VSLQPTKKARRLATPGFHKAVVRRDSPGVTCAADARVADSRSIAAVAIDRNTYPASFVRNQTAFVWKTWLPRTWRSTTAAGDFAAAHTNKDAPAAQFVRAKS
jgi:hypothetical protein